MPRIPVQDLKEGMVLNDDVKDKKGRLLLPKDNTITLKHIRTFKTWGVTMVSVGIAGAEDIDGDAYEVDEAVIKSIKEDLDKNFKHNNLEHPFVNQLYNICLQRTVVKKSRGEI
ncbi:hypothetical protein BVY03_02965 [bacterium K02(2017)]|nr:hypothetical protein BVY03_02965 [bacterium K02(2017)]